MDRTGVLLLNLGTPEAPTPKAVAGYLRQFLMDRWVIDLPWLLRWFLVNVLIVPKRRYASAELYGKVWSDDGSPLLIHSRTLAEEVQKSLGPRYIVAIGMRYGQPSIRSALEKLKADGCKTICIFPLYPQYAESTTRSSVEECFAQARQLGLNTDPSKLHMVAPFYDDHGFISAYAEQIRPVLERERPDHVLFSYHGLPERYIRRTDQSPDKNHCLRSTTCCDRIVAANRDCYRAQCFATTRLLAEVLGLNKENYSVAFQSRLGRAAWIRPYIDDVYKSLPKSGVRHLAVVCPSFTADCLETIEEIGLRGSESFKEAGGERFTRIECLNARPRWVEAVCDLVNGRAPAHGLGWERGPAGQISSD